MHVIDEVRKEREDLARVLKKHSGIRKIVEDLYPDSAHFIYELLQNAEDTGATEAHFVLSESSLIFEHNGRTFEEKDIYAITDIGEGTKANDDDKIGRFGVGFKAVFAYSETPHIWSPSYSFKITDLVLPHPIASLPELGNRTRFEFPFNNAKKELADAYEEIADGLEELAETTLLFLSHLVSISWRTSGSENGEVLRINHTQNHCEVLKQKGGKTTTSSHFLKFELPVLGLETQRIAIAYALDFLPNVSHFDSNNPISKQLKIVPANPGKVAVFFPAEKETSGLRFHLHAPFVPELSRASIKETPANAPLFKQLSALAASSLHDIKKLGFLNADFLGVLPNPQDTISARYNCIRIEIVEEMNSKSLTPTHSKSFAPARYLLQGRAAIKSLLTDNDIKLLVDYDEAAPKWAIGAIKGSNSERFLDSLDIQVLDSDQFYEMLCNKLSEDYCNPYSRPAKFTPHQFSQWLAKKDEAWFQQLYSLLYDYIQLHTIDWRKAQVVLKLRQLTLVKTIDGKLRTGKNCYFACEGIEDEDSLPSVNSATYSSGRNKAQQENARKFLEAIGVREIGEVELVEALLAKRYRDENFSPKKSDIKRFVLLVENNPAKAKIFANYHIFERKDGKWGQPCQTYLDEPFVETGLNSYYDIQNDETICLLSSYYLNCGVNVNRLIKFAELVGCKTKLQIGQMSCHYNPQWQYLCSVPGERYTSPINQDYTIIGLNGIFCSPTVKLSKLIWKTMCSLPAHTNYLKARYRKNETNGSRYADSTLVHLLRNNAWIPQNDIFVKPRDASRDLLPDGFTFDSEWEWLKAIQFGIEAEKRSEETRQKQDLAKKSGFVDVATLERAQRFAALPPEEQVKFLEEFDRKKKLELPENQSPNPERRAKNVESQIENDPEKATEKRMRSVSVGRDDVKKEAGQYLKNQYVNSDGTMICQICKDALPFKVGDEYYFEKVELFRDVDKHHHQNYLALCPNHSAMFQYANGSKDMQYDMFKKLNTNELDVVLAEMDMSIYFTSNHRLDLQTIMKQASDNEDK